MTTNTTRDELAFQIANTRCMTKSVFPSLIVAAKHAAKHGKKYGAEMRPYQCGVCGMFHITSQPKHHIPRKDIPS